MKLLFRSILGAALCLGSAFAQLNQSGGAGGGNQNITQWGSTGVLTGGIAGSVGVGGLAAVGVAAVGAPVYSGGVFNTTPSTLTSGQVGALQLDATQNLLVKLSVNPTIANTTFGLIAGTAVVGTVQMVPKNACSAGQTLVDITQVAVATGAGTAITAADTCVISIVLTNNSATSVTAQIADKSGTPVIYSNTFSIPPNSDVIRMYSGMKFLSGVQIISGTTTSLNARLIGVQ